MAQQSAPSNRIWNNTTLRSPKQQIWLRTTLCGGWCRHMALRNRELHARNDDWLPVCKRINFKIATFAYQSLAFGQPTYLSLVLMPQRSLRSVNQNLLSVPRCNSSFGQRSFSYCAPKIWNDIPLSVRQSLSLDSFKRNLKTHYFASNWPPGDCLQRLWFDIFDIVRSTNEWINGNNLYFVCSNIIICSPHSRIVGMYSLATY